MTIIVLYWYSTLHKSGLNSYFGRARVQLCKTKVLILVEDQEEVRGEGERFQQ
jgi:hypothetical protein